MNDKIFKEIEQERQKLYALIHEFDDFKHPQVIEQSQYIDKLLNKAQNVQSHYNYKHK